MEPVERQESPLECARYWFLSSARYSGSRLELTLLEGIVSDATAPLVIGGKDYGGELKSIDAGPGSRAFRITFDKVVTFQILPELLSHCRYGDPGPTVVAARGQSEYLDSLRGEHAPEWWNQGTSKHYTVSAEDSVVHVITPVPPRFEELRRGADA